MSKSNKRYKGYGSDEEFDSMEEFARARLDMKAPALGGYNWPAYHYTWSVLEDGRERNPTSEEKDELYQALLEHGGDCDSEDVSISC